MKREWSLTSFLSQFRHFVQHEVWVHMYSVDVSIIFKQFIDLVILQSPSHLDEGAVYPFPPGMVRADVFGTYRHPLKSKLRWQVARRQRASIRILSCRGQLLTVQMGIIPVHYQAKRDDLAR